MSIYKNKIIRHLLVIISVIFLFVAIYLLMGINYAVCDDTAMRNIASGAQTGTPDGHLVYIMYPLGWFMATLYKSIIILIGMVLFLLFYKLFVL